MSILKIIFQIGLIIIIASSLFHWVRTGFWVPKYIHFIAIAAGLVSAALSYYAYSINDPKANKTIYLALGFPVAVYIIYGLYGGGQVSKEIKVNDGLVIDRAMLKDEVIEVFNEHFTLYTKMNFENLLLVTANKQQSEVQGKSGKTYLFEVSAEAYDEDDDEKVVALYGKLTEFKRKLYKPQSHIAFVVCRNGTILGDGLNFET